MTSRAALVRAIPSTSRYLFSVPGATRPWSGDGVLTPHHLGIPETARRWYAGREQSDIDYGVTVAGRPVQVSRLEVPDVNVDALSTFFTAWASLRVTFTWPSVVARTAPGYPALGQPNRFQETDVIQVATPNLSGNARFFVTGNTPGVTPQGAPHGAANYFGKYGFTVPPAAYDGRGAARTLAPHQPIHAVTGSLWISNNADGCAALPNAYTTPVGGGTFCDIAFSGIRGYLNPEAAAGLSGLYSATEARLEGTRDASAGLAVGVHPDNPSPTGRPEEAHANPALLDGPTHGDRVMFVWMKQDQGGSPNAYGAWGGAVLTQGSGRVVTGGGTTIVEPLVMGQFKTNPAITMLFAGQDGLANQALDGRTGIAIWRRAAFEALVDRMGAPATAGNPARVRVADPSSDATEAAPLTAARFATGPTRDGIPANSLVVYGLRNRAQGGAVGVLGEAGLEPGSPVLAQWWNTGTGDLPESAFPGVIRAWASGWLPAEFTPVVHVEHAFVGAVQYPGHGPADAIARVHLRAGLAAPCGHALLARPQGLVPVVGPVVGLNLADLQANTASGTLTYGTRLDLHLGTAGNLENGGPTAGLPPFKTADGNHTGADHRLSADSTLVLGFSSAAGDLRLPSGYVVSLYRLEEVGGAPARTRLHLVREFRLGHSGEAGTAQQLFLPSLRWISPALPQSNQAFVLKVRTVWYEDELDPEGRPLDLGKAPFVQRVPTAYADALSGVFVAAY